jgi:hypothetical protein
MFNELDVVIVSTLCSESRHVTGTSGIVRQPYLGDIGTIVHVHAPTDYIVECVDENTGGTLWLADFRIDELVSLPPAWRFHLSETSAGVYTATGEGPRGMHVESTDADPA